MSSEVQICNQALSFLGAQLITSLDDNTVPAQLCKLHYAPLRDTVLSDGNWTFAMARRRLSADPTPPEFGWSNRYRLPNDLLRVVRVFTDASIGARRSGVEHQREGDFLLVNYGGPLYLQYIARITDPSKFSPGFIQALAARIAADLAIPITRNPTLAGNMMKLYEQKRDDAAVDMTQSSQDVLEANVLKDARRTPVVGYP